MKYYYEYFYKGESYQFSLLEDETFVLSNLSHAGEYVIISKYEEISKYYAVHYKDGALHREDGPASIDFMFLNEEFHLVLSDCEFYNYYFSNRDVVEIEFCKLGEKLPKVGDLIKCSKDPVTKKSPLCLVLSTQQIDKILWIELMTEEFTKFKAVLNLDKDNPEWLKKEKARHLKYLEVCREIETKIHETPKEIIRKTW